MSALLPKLLTASSVILTANAVVLAAERPPNFNIEPACRAAGDTGLPGRDKEACKRDENNARTKLDEEWTTFPADDRAKCVRLTSFGGAPSYVEVLTCLETAREVRNAPQDGGARNR